MPVNKNDSSKSSENAEAARVEGNKFYAERSFFDALVKYNESLCHAMPESEAIGLAFANRSAVFFEMKLFEKCLQNIAQAKDNFYPEKNYSVLEKRADKCIEQISLGNESHKDENPFDFIKLSYDANPKLPFVANCLELKKSDKFGRYIVTSCDLKVGDVVAIEKPHFKIIKSDSRYESCQQSNKYQRCSNCLKSNLMDLIPCLKCSSAMFCDFQCQQEAFEAFHALECPIIEKLLKSGIMQLPIRTLFQALSIFNGSIDDLIMFLDDNKNKSACVYDFDFSVSNTMSAAKSFLLSLYCLANSGKVCITDSPEALLKDHPLLGNVWRSHEMFIREFIQNVLQVGDSNFHGICGYTLQKYQHRFPRMIGIGCYPFISLVNHGCAPNVNRIYVEDKMLLMVERPIKRGEQLFDCYKNTFFTLPNPTRQAELLKEYSFRCDCVACTNNFPIFHNLKSVDKKIYKIAKKGKDELSKLDSSQAKRKFKVYCEIIQGHHDKAFPSSEIVLLQECILQCISVVIQPKLVFP